MLVDVFDSAMEHVNPQESYMASVAILIDEHLLDGSGPGVD